MSTHRFGGPGGFLGCPPMNDHIYTSHDTKLSVMSQFRRTPDATFSNNPTREKMSNVNVRKECKMTDV